MTNKPDYQRVFKTRPNGAEMAQFASTVWDELTTELRLAGLLTKSRLGLADRYSRARTEYEYLYSTAMTDGPTRKADSGGEYANMSWSAVGKLSEQLAKMEDALLLTPKAAGEKPPIASPPKKWTAADEYLD